MKNKVLIGTSGWGYDEWVGPFYPKSLKKEDYLSYYSEIFYTNEINTTFYNIPSRWTIKSWVDKTPSDFLFTAKVFKSITHENKLDVDLCSHDLDIFLGAMEPLMKSEKLLGFLIQLPPSFNKVDHFGILKEFIRHWPGNPKSEGYHLILEFRHLSWMDDEVFNYLKKKELTYCAVIEPLLPPRMDITNPKLAYIRFHGYGKQIWFDYFFKGEEIRKWAVSIKEVIDRTDRVGIYFNNHFSGYAAKNSLMMMRELDVEPRNEPNKVSLLDIKKKAGTYSAGQTGLDKFLN
ncbi:MAG: DUF72 domain-containing protein [Candidatus Lokiarchaeota archaeon]|nr:DUF72 domain-containing protein [Candidatus Lokiarchaeota archaeon]